MIDEPARDPRRTDPVPRGGQLILDRRQRDVLQRFLVDVETGHWAICGFEIDPPDPAEQGERRVRLDTALSMIDELGWSASDTRSSFTIALRDEHALVLSLRRWRDWQIQALDDIRRDRRNGLSVPAGARELLTIAERLSVIGALLTQIDPCSP